MVLQEDVEPQQQEESGPYEEVYKDSSTFLKVELNKIMYYIYIAIYMWNLTLFRLLFFFK